MSSNCIPMTLDVTHAEIMSALERILESRRFSGSIRTTAFLRFVVERSLDGRGSEIKEVVIASELYGYARDYDPRVHSMVRVEATRVRARLRDYYENEGLADPVRVAIPKGSYVPLFERAAGDACVNPEQALAPAARARNLRPGLVIAAAFICCAAVLSLNARQPERAPSQAQSESREAWKDGVRLLSLDPHLAMTDAGIPKPLSIAIERFERAVELDPQFAHGWASLAESYDYAHAYVGRNREEDRKRARDAAARSVRLDGAMAYGHAMLAMISLYLDWNFEGAEVEYRRALELDPKNPYALAEYVDLLRVKARHHEALGMLRKARTASPALPVLAAKEAEVLADLNLLDAAERAAREALELQKDNGRSRVVLGLVFERRGRLDSALAEYRKALEIDAFDRRALPAAGFVLAKLNRREEAVEVLRKLETMNARVRNCSTQIAVVHAGLGNKADARAWIEKARETRQSSFPMLGLEWRLKSLYPDERFQRLLLQSDVPAGRRASE